MTASKEYSIPDWRKLSVDEPYYDSTKNKYCIAVSTDISYVSKEHADLALDGPNDIKLIVKRQGVDNLAQFYNKETDGLDVLLGLSRDRRNPATRDPRDPDDSVIQVVDIEDYYMDSRPCSRLRYLVCVDARYWDLSPQREVDTLLDLPVPPVEEVVRYKLPELNDLLNSVADSFLELAQNIATTNPGLDFIQESERLRAVYPSVLNLLFKNGFSEEEVSGLSIQFDFGPATLDQEPTAENCLKTDEIINIGVERPRASGFEELLIAKLTFLNNAPIKYARTRKYLRNLRDLGKKLDCPDNVGIWNRELYEGITDAVEWTQEKYEIWERHANSRRGQQILSGIRERKVWPYNDKSIKTAEEAEAEEAALSDIPKGEVDEKSRAEFDFVGSVLMSAKTQREFLDEIEDGKDAYRKFLDRFDVDYLLRIGTRLGLDLIRVEDINQTLFEVAMRGLDHDDIWGEDGLVANCIPEHAADLQSLQGSSDECEDPNAAVKERILELHGSGEISEEALQTCIQTVCPPTSRMFGLKGQVEGLLAYATSDLIPYNRDELCPDPGDDQHPWEGIDTRRFSVNLPSGSDLWDLGKAAVEEFVEALQDTRDELVLGIVRQLLQMLIQNVERILCNWTDMRSFGTALGDAIVEGELGVEIEDFAREEIWINNIRAGMRSAISDWGLNPEEFFPTDDPEDPRSYDQRLTDFINEVYACLNPGEFRAALRGVELGENLEIVEMATKNNLPCINPGDMLAIMGRAGEDLPLPAPNLGRPGRRPGESICDSTHADQVERNFRDSYTDRADEAVIQELWEKELENLKKRVSQLLEMLNNQDLACTDASAPSPAANEMVMAMQQNASNGMFTGLLEIVGRILGDLAGEGFVQLDDDGSMVLVPVDVPEESRELTVVERLKELFIDIMTLGLGLGAELREYEVEAIAPALQCDDAAVSVQVPPVEGHGNDASVDIFQMLPNCQQLLPSPGRSYFTRKGSVRGLVTDSMYEYERQIDQETYDTLLGDPRAQFFEFSPEVARKLSSEQYAFSNFLISSVAADYRLTVGDLDIFDDPNIATGALNKIRRTLYKEILQETISQITVSDFQMTAQEYLTLVEHVQTQSSEILKIQKEIDETGERFSQRIEEQTSSRDSFANPPLQAASQASLVKVFIRLEIFEKFITLLPTIPKVGQGMEKSEIFNILVTESVLGTIQGKYSSGLDSVKLALPQMREILLEEDNISLEDFIAEEIQTLVGKFTQAGISVSSYFENLPMKSVPERAFPVRHVEEGPLSLEFFVDARGRAHPSLESSFDRHDSYPWLEETVKSPAWKSYDYEGPQDFATNIDTVFEGNTPVFYVYDDQGQFIFERYLQFEPLTEEEFEQRVVGLEGEQAHALRDIRRAFEGRLVNSGISRQQVENVESFRSFYKRVMINAFLKHSHIGRSVAAQYGIEVEDLELSEWPYDEFDARNLGHLRKIESYFFETQLYNNKLESVLIDDALSLHDDPDSPAPDFWMSLPLNNIFKGLECGVRVTFFHTDIPRTHIDRNVFIPPGAADIINHTPLLAFPGDLNRGFDDVFPERYEDSDWHDICNIRKSYDVSFFQEPRNVDPDTPLGTSLKRVFTIPLAHEEEDLLARGATMANFYGNLGFFNFKARPAEGGVPVGPADEEALDGAERNRQARDLEARGPTNYHSAMADAHPSVFWEKETRGWRNHEICDFNKLKTRLIKENDIFKAFFEFAVPIDDLVAVRANDFLRLFGENEVLREAKESLLLTMYALQLSPATIGGSLQGPNAAKEWLEQNFS